MNFNEKLQRLVSEQSLNKSKASRDAGLPESTISSYLAKPESLPRVDIALKIARVLGVPLDWMADDSQDFPPPSDSRSIGTVPDDVLMQEACRRLANQAKRVAFDLDRVKKENWTRVADELLAIPATEELSTEHERKNFLLSLLFGSKGNLLEYDASHVLKCRGYPAPDLDDLLHEIKALHELPEFDTLKAYFSLRHVADFLKRNKATQADWDARDVEGQRKELIASLARKRKEKTAKT